MDPGYTIRHRATRRGLRVVLELTATGSAPVLSRVAGRAAEEIRELLEPPRIEAPGSRSRRPRPDSG